MLTARVVAAQLGGVKCSRGYNSRCPVKKHKVNKMPLLIRDRQDGKGISIKCYAGCDFVTQLVPAMKELGLWESRDLSSQERKEIANKKEKREFVQAIEWVMIYKSNKALRTPQDDAKYKRIAEQHKYRIWAYGVLQQAKNNIRRRITEKQLQVILKAVKILN